MTTFKWDRKLETGIEEIDRQHEELFRRIDQLDLSIYEGRSKTEMVMILEYLGTYVKEHFSAEELLLRSIGFPGISAHLQEHREFAELYDKIKNEYRAKGADSYLALDVDRAIRKWWEKHILKSDMAFVPYVTKHA
jgi:hemerythrin